MKAHEPERCPSPYNDEAIPTPALLPGLIGLGFSAIRKRNQAEVEEA